MAEFWAGLLGALIGAAAAIGAQWMQAWTADKSEATRRSQAATEGCLGPHMANTTPVAKTP